MPVSALPSGRRDRTLFHFIQTETILDLLVKSSL